MKPFTRREKFALFLFKLHPGYFLPRVLGLFRKLRAHPLEVLLCVALALFLGLFALTYWLSYREYVRPVPDRSAQFHPNAP